MSHKKTGRPISRVLSKRSFLPPVPSSISTATYETVRWQPTRNVERTIPLLLDFAPDEVYRATTIADGAVVSYTTFSPFPLAL